MPLDTPPASSGAGTEFQQTAQGAKEQCPVSGLFKANTEITLDASLV